MLRHLLLLCLGARRRLCLLACSMGVGKWAHQVLLYGLAWVRALSMPGWTTPCRTTRHQAIVGGCPQGEYLLRRPLVAAAHVCFGMGMCCTAAQITASQRADLRMPAGHSRVLGTLGRGPPPTCAVRLNAICLRASMA